jgi:hypothetical protein
MSRRGASREADPEKTRESFDELVHHGSEVDLAREGLPHLDDRALQPQTFGKEEPVDRSLNSVPERLEQQHDRECEHHREEWRRRELCAPKHQVEGGDAQRVDRRDQGCGGRVEQALAQNHPDVEELVADDGVGKRDRNQDQRNRAVDQESLGLEEARERHGQHDERRDAE